MRLYYTSDNDNKNKKQYNKKPYYIVICIQIIKNIARCFVAILKWI